MERGLLGRCIVVTTWLQLPSTASIGRSIRKEEVDALEQKLVGHRPEAKFDGSKHTTLEIDESARREEATVRIPYAQPLERAARTRDGCDGEPAVTEPAVTARACAGGCAS